MSHAVQMSVATAGTGLALCYQALDHIDAEHDHMAQVLWDRSCTAQVHTNSHAALK